MFSFVKRSVRDEIQAYGEKLAILIHANLTSICCVYKEKIDKKSERVMITNLIPNKSFRYYNQ